MFSQVSSTPPGTLGIALISMVGLRQGLNAGQTEVLDSLGIALISTVGLQAMAGVKAGAFPAPEGPKHVARGQSEAATPG